MSSAPIYRDQSTKTQSSVRRGSPGAQAGARAVTARPALGGPDRSGLVMPPSSDYFYVDGFGLTVGAGSIVDLATIGTRDDQSAYMSWNGGGYIEVSAGGWYEIEVTVGMNAANVGPFTMALPSVLNVVVPVSGPATTWAGSTTLRLNAGGGFAPCQVRNYAASSATIDSFSMYCRALVVEA